MEALTIISWISIALGALSFIIIYVDIQMGRYQGMTIMNIAWPVTALFMWPLVLFMYFKYGRAKPGGEVMDHSHHQHHEAAAKHEHHEEKPEHAHCAHHAGHEEKTTHDHSHHEHHHDHDHSHHHGEAEKKTPAFVNMYISSTHCASGCSIADIIGEASIFILGLTIAGSFIWTGFIVDYILALIIGLAFQYYSIKPMQPDTARGTLLWQAFKADILSLTSFQIGMYAWLFISVYLIFGQAINAGDPIFWFMMQIAMMLGMFTTMPVNKWLIKVGIKHACH
jgi:cation transport ATPase